MQCCKSTSAVFRIRQVVEEEETLLTWNETEAPAQLHTEVTSPEACKF